MRKLVLFLLLPSLFQSLGCDEKITNVDSCGDGFVDPGEECDGEVGENTCASLGHYEVLGVLACSKSCRFDLTDCGGRCGDSAVDADDGEQCDGENLNGQSCQGLGYGGGVLTCAADCRYDIQNCTNACGNGYVEGGESCDDGNQRNNDGCSSGCVVEDGWTCSANDPSACTPICQDGQAVGSEECDITDLKGVTCTTLGFYGGELACTFTCELDPTECESAGRCGDGILQASFSEICDGNNLNGQSCETLGYYGGSLACSSDCRSFNEAACINAGRCGDGTVQVSAGELCDGNNLGGRTCQTQGFYAGNLVCNADCRTLDTSSCMEYGRCGDGTVQTNYGELCDGANLNAQTCLTRGFYGGVLSCNANCLGYDESQCIGRCGDGTAQVSSGEVCDGADLRSVTCEALGYYTGVLTCNSNCLSFNESGCSGVCGDNTVQSGYGEACDGLNVSGQTCTSLGYYGGTLGCLSNCSSLDTTSCASVGRCGDGNLQPMFGELCDGANLNGQNCISHGFYEGTLGCTANCLGFDLSGCVGRCGDGNVQTTFGEVCDGGNFNGDSCEAKGYHGGALVCAADCRSVNIDSCISVGRCGDGVIQGSFGEDCDGSNLGSTTCTTLGYNGGTLWCDSDCNFNLTNCAATGRCGDGILQPTYEACEAGNLNGQTCQTQGFYLGTLACDAATCLFDTSSCQERCGDGIVQGAYEDCDGSNLNSQTCVTQGYYPGTLGCDAACDFDVTNCGGDCGDGIVQEAHEDCDGSNLNSQTCETQGHYPGTLACGASCDFTFASCGGSCGDGIVQWAYENCDGSTGGATCSSLAYMFGGSLTCDGTCHLDGCKGIEALAPGGRHACLLLSDGTVRCWGANNAGQLGDGTTTTRPNPVTVLEIDSAVHISAAKIGISGHTCAVLAGGAVKCWGLNTSGQLGDGTTTTQSTPVFVTGITTAVAVAAGNTHTCALLSVGGVKCWGAGILGDGSSSSSLVPVDVVGISTAIAVASGAGHNCALLNDGTVKCWGGNNYGQLGDGTLINRLTPVSVTLSPASSIALGADCSCAVLGDGTANCWGNNEFGQLGDGTDTQRTTPVQVSGLSGVVQIFPGTRVGMTPPFSHHNCARLADGTLRCWGGNGYGEIGDGTTTSRLTPRAVLDITNSSFVSAGAGFSCAVVNDKKSAQCWGYNSHYQLGNGTTTNSSVPVTIVP